MSSSPKAWMVRSGRKLDEKKPDRIFEDYAIDHSLAIIGWHLPDLTGIPDSESEARAELKRLYGIEYPKASNNSVGVSVGQIYKFLQIREMDIVVMPRGDEIAIGKVKGDYFYEDQHLDEPEKWHKGWRLREGRHRIPVEWELADVPKADLGIGIRPFLKNHQTVAEFKDEGLIEELRRLVELNSELGVAQS